MMKIITILLSLAISTAALAQQVSPIELNDPVFLQRLIAGAQAQRAAAQDAAIIAEARAATLMQELAKAKTRIEELEKEKK